jgi:signal transduction histidine kinase
MRVWSTLPVRLRVALTAAVIVCLSLTAAGTALTYTQRALLTGRLDDALQDRAADVAALIGTGQVPAQLANRTGRESFIQIVGSGGVVVASSENVAGLPPVAAGAGASGRPGVTAITGLPIGDADDTFRVAVVEVETAGGRFTVFVGGADDFVSDVTEVTVLALAGGVPLMTAVVGLVGWYMAGKALGPVESIRAEVAGISGSSLGRRVPVPESRDEVARLAATMNGMLDRIEEAHTRQRQFVSDASHELRGPLAGIRATLEVSGTDSARGGQDAAVAAALHGVGRLQELIDDLLADAEVSDGELRNATVLDLDDMVLDEARSAAAGTAKAVDVSGVSAAQVLGNAQQLRRAVRNLLSNATRHARSRVTVALREGVGLAVLEVSDDGPGVPGDRRDRIFERFGRADESRDRGSGGTGLGLAITRAIAERHGGKVYLDGAYSGGARFVMEIPLAAE